MTDAFDRWLELRSIAPATGYLDLYDLAASDLGVTVEKLPLPLRRELATKAMPVLFPGHQLQSERGSWSAVSISEPDPSWVLTFTLWRGRIQDALGAEVRIEHVGSTSVPMLPAKPIVDVQVSVPNINDEDAYVAQLVSLGLDFRSREHGHRFFPLGQEGRRVLHVHVCEIGSVWERDHLAFRDYLRSHPPTRDDYARLKRELAARWHDDRMAYTEAKGDFIKHVLGLAIGGGSSA